MMNGSELDSSVTPILASPAPAKDSAHSVIYLESGLAWRMQGEVLFLWLHSGLLLVLMAPLLFSNRPAQRQRNWRWCGLCDTI